MCLGGEIALLGSGLSGPGRIKLKAKQRWDVVGLILVLLLVLALWPGSRMLQLWRHLDSLQAALQSLEAHADSEALRHLRPADIAALQGDFATVESLLATIEAEARPFLPLA